MTSPDRKAVLLTDTPQTCAKCGADRSRMAACGNVCCIWRLYASITLRRADPTIITPGEAERAER